jgi:hypothetical protein
MRSADIRVAPELQRYADLDQRLLAAVRGIHILGTVGWPASLENRMIKEFRRCGSAGRLPAPHRRVLAGRCRNAGSGGHGGRH